MAKEEDVGSALALKGNTTSTTSTKTADQHKQLDGQPVSVSKPRESSRRRKRYSRNPRNKPLLFQSRPPRVPILPPPPPPPRVFNQLSMRFLFEKRLQKSDVSPAGRIVIHKKDAEMYLPALEAKDGFWMHLDDMDFMQVWSIKFRYWPNNTSRMYVFENTRDFIAGHGLAYGDFIMVFKDEETGSYVSSHALLRFLLAGEVDRLADDHEWVKVQPVKVFWFIASQK
nr:B3 domain-containing transcription factor FUS3-like isoform X2 [Ziziphus jujuba var. spinosa]